MNRTRQVTQIFRKMFLGTDDMEVAIVTAQMVFDRAGVTLLDWAFTTEERKEEMADRLWNVLVELEAEGIDNATKNV